MYLSLLGAIVAFALAIYLILKKLPPFYAMAVGAFVGGLLVVIATPELMSDGLISGTVTLMVDGSKNVMSSVLRILAAGVLAGFLIESKSAESIANFITEKLGAEQALIALALSTLILTSVGVFIDIAVITVSPIALSLARRTDLSRLAILVAMIGGGKCGNIISPNPNTIAAAEAFNADLTMVIIAGIFPAIIGFIVTVFISKRIKHGTKVGAEEVMETDKDSLPSIGKAIVAPITVIILLTMRPLFGLNIDPLIALPAGGIVGAIALGQHNKLIEYTTFGLEKMKNVAIMLIGTGALAGVISASSLGAVVIDILEKLSLPAFLLAPFSGALMSFATASTTTGASTAASVFGPTLLDMGVGAVAAAAMINAAATVFDHMPHGSFFHSTSGSVNMKFNEALSMIGYASIVGATLAISSILVYVIIGA